MAKALGRVGTQVLRKVGKAGLSSTARNEPGGLVTRARSRVSMEKSETNVGVGDGSDYFGDLRCAGAAKRAGGKSNAASAEQTHERLSFRVVPSIPTPEPPLAAHFFGVSRASIGQSQSKKEAVRLLAQ